MKRVNASYLQVQVGIDLETVESIQFKFSQSTTKGEISRIVRYPSDEVRRTEDGSVLEIYWSADQTAMFKSSQDVQMDTRIKLLNSDCNPDTSIATFRIRPSLFEIGEVE